MNRARIAEEVQMGSRFGARLVGIELYFEDLQQGKRFYTDTLDLDLLEEVAGHHAKFGAGQAFVCLERKGAETYPSLDKAVVFLEVSDLAAAVEHIGRERILEVQQHDRVRRPWAVMRDPEGYNVVLLEAAKDGSGVEVV
jgi:predicted enzyme related to lactoylglutathione lyase